MMEIEQAVCIGLIPGFMVPFMSMLSEQQERLFKLKLKRKRKIFREKLKSQLNQHAQQFMQSCAQLGHIIPEMCPKRKRRMWAKTRSIEWWEKIVPQFGEDDWLENFRMTRHTFEFICDSLRDELSPNPNYVRLPLSVEKKVAVALYKLASCAEYRMVGNQFGIHKSTVQKCVYSFCKATVKVLMETYIKMPTDTEAEEVATIFERISGMPQVIGAIDGTHIPILPPTNGYRDYVNRKGWPSYNMQAVVDAQYMFRDITVKHPGSNHDANVLKDSNLYKHPEETIPRVDKVIDGVEIPLMIIGDPAYPLLPWLMVGYKMRGNADPTEESFNVYLSRARIVVENAFGRLKARWRCLLKRNDMNYKFVPYVIATCCVLHNLVETRKEKFVQQWLRNVEEGDVLFEQPNDSRNRDLDSFNAANVRNHLKAYMSRNFPLLTSTFR